jgi:hypothetical protein
LSKKEPSFSITVTSLSDQLDLLRITERCVLVDWTDRSTETLLSCDNKHVDDFNTLLLYSQSTDYDDVDDD